MRTALLQTLHVRMDLPAQGLATGQQHEAAVG